MTMEKASPSAEVQPISDPCDPYDVLRELLDARAALDDWHCAVMDRQRPNNLEGVLAYQKKENALVQRYYAAILAGYLLLAER